MADANAEALIPLYGFVEGDVLGLLVLVSPDETLAVVAERLLHLARLRVARPSAFMLHWKGAPVVLTRSVAHAGLQPLDRIDIVIGEGA